MLIYLVEICRDFEGITDVTLHETPRSVIDHYKKEYYTIPFALQSGEQKTFKCKHSKTQNIVVTLTEVYK